MEEKDYKDKSNVLWIIGAGGRGLNTLNRLIDMGYNTVNMLAISDKEDRLQLSNCKLKHFLQEDVNKSLEELFSQIELPKNASIIIVNGLGGESEQYIPKLIEKLKAYGNTVISIVSMPFTFESVVRKKTATHYKEQIKSNSDVMISFKNDKILQNADRKTPFEEALELQDKVVLNIVNAATDSFTENEEFSTQAFIESMRKLQSMKESLDFEMFCTGD